MSFAKHARILSVTTLGLLLAPVAACAGSSQTIKASEVTPTSSESAAYVSEKSHSDYAKPGAAVTVSHDYSGHNKLGAVENIRVSFKGARTDGVMTVKILPSNGLNIATAVDVQTFQMSDFENHHMDLSVSGQNDGQYFVNLLITVDKGVGNMSSQSYGIPIYVGAAAAAKPGSVMKDTNEAKKKISGGLIVMEAQETIIQ